MMSSSGSLQPATHFRASASLLSGPAGGVTGTAAVARALDLERVLGFDMGGTSTDVARWAGAHDYVFQHRVGAGSVATPALAIHTVAAGGGSLCQRRGGVLQVGPGSAGASPGPACYGGGGPLSLTDINLLSGRLDRERFPLQLDEEAARMALAVLCDTEESLVDLLDGFRAVADETMAEAIRRVSVRRGHDPSVHVLIAFGGAGAQHVCTVAECLGMRRAVVPAEAGLLSARGLAEARSERFASRQVFSALEDSDLPDVLAAVQAEARAALAGDGWPAAAMRCRVQVDCRFYGQESSLDVPVAAAWDAVAVRRAFLERYAQIYGRLAAADARRPVEVVALRAQADIRQDLVLPPPHAASDPAQPSGATRLRSAGAWHTAPVYQRDSLATGQCIPGPALIREEHSCTVVDVAWQARLHPSGHLLLERAASGGAVQELAAQHGSAAASLVAHRLTAIAEEMGALLERTAVSTNVKIRRDFSCAILDAEGRLLVNAPHVPVHLGALGVCARALLRAHPISPGEAWLVNHPAWGGSHLPDVTLLSGVHDADGRLLALVANRCHHAEIGGIRPGSMPPDGRRLSEEGVVFEPLRVLVDDRLELDAVEQRLRAGPWPSRRPADNLADLRAAIAANRRGVAALRSLVDELGSRAARGHMQRLLDAAAAQARAALRRLPQGVRSALMQLDAGQRIAVRLQPGRGRVHIDCSGTSPTDPGNRNATPAIVRSCILYVLRLLVDEDVPLNEGFAAVVDLAVPAGSMLDPAFDPDPERCPAVVGGNVEVSQCLVDCLLEACDIAAGSQGTMNNVLIGDERFGYYETVGGGAGATATAPGASGVHVHMTNTAITDVELFELRYPVRIEHFALRRASGGRGRHAGGDGLVRRYRFLAPLEVAVLAEHRRHAPR
ncbi:MAG: hydantoinase B/oxoprolinase family protein, partial [Planctomycetota bacterium]